MKFFPVHSVPSFPLNSHPVLKAKAPWTSRVPLPSYFPFYVCVSLPLQFLHLLYSFLQSLQLYTHLFKCFHNSSLMKWSSLPHPLKASILQIICCASWSNCRNLKCLFSSLLVVLGYRSLRASCFKLQAFLHTLSHLSVYLQKVSLIIG